MCTGSNSLLKMLSRCAPAALALLLLGGWVSPVQALPVTVSTSQGNLSAEIGFDVSGTDLIVTVTATTPDDITGASQVLTAIFFDLPGDPVLTPISALLPAGSTVMNGPDGGGNVGGEWTYAVGDFAFLGSEAISSSGLQLGFPSPNFNGDNLEGPDSVNGPQYALTSIFDDPSSYQGRNTPLIMDTVVFTLGGLPGGITPQDVTNVRAAWGTSNPVPEPGVALLFAVGALIVTARVRRR